MEESQLTKIAVFLALIGFLALVLILIFQPPLQDATLDDSIVQFDATVTSLRTTARGSTLSFDHVISSRGFIDQNISFPPNTLVSITAKKSGDFFFISTLFVK